MCDLQHARLAARLDALLQHIHAVDTGADTEHRHSSATTAALNHVHEAVQEALTNGMMSERIEFVNYKHKRFRKIGLGIGGIGLPRLQDRKKGR